MTSANFHELIDSLSKANTVEDIHTVCSLFCERFDFDRFLYGARLPTSFVKPYLISISGYPKDWRTRYTEEGYITIDPTIIHCATHLTPITWDKIGINEKENKLIHRFMNEARDFNLNSGVSFPVHSPQGESAMLSLSSSKDHLQARPQILEVMPHAHLFAAYLHENVRRIFEQQVLPLKRAQLTDRERECLLWAAEGKTAWETAKILGVAERTVIFHLQNAGHKLNVVSRQHAVARAVSLGLITPQLV